MIDKVIYKVSNLFKKAAETKVDTIEEVHGYEEIINKLFNLIPTNNHEEADKLFGRLLIIDREINDLLFEHNYNDIHITIDNIKKWAIEKELDKTDPHKQMLKVTEEIGEVSGAIAKENIDEAKVEIGDAIVTLIILSMQLDLDIADCARAAYEKIENRKGKMINGIFVKEGDIVFPAKVSEHCIECGIWIDKENETFITIEGLSNGKTQDEAVKCYGCYKREQK